MVSSNKKKRGKQRKAIRQQQTAEDSPSAATNQLVVYTPNGEAYVHPNQHKLITQYFRRGDNKATKILRNLTKEDVPTNGICWPNISLDQSGIVSSTLNFLKRCEEDTFDKVLVDARDSISAPRPRGGHISYVGGDLKSPVLWIKVLSKAVELEPICKVKIARSIGPLVSCMCNDMTRLFFQSNKHWEEGILPFVELVSNMISNSKDSTNKKVVNSLLKYEGLLESVIEWNFWDKHRPDLVIMENCTEIAALGRAIVRKLVINAGDNPSAEDRQLLGSIGSMPIVSKDYEPNCMISYTAGLICYYKKRKGSKEGFKLDLIGDILNILQPLIEIGDCIDKGVIMGMIDLGINYVNDYDRAVFVARLSAGMLRKGTDNKSCDTRIAFAIRCGLIDMCLNFIESFGTNMSCEGGSDSQCRCRKCLESSLYNHITSMFKKIYDLVLHQKTAKAIRSKRDSIEFELDSLEEDERITSNPKCKKLLDMVRSIMSLSGSFCCRCNKSLSKTEVMECNGCHSMVYCSRACQKDDWMNGHKLTCCNSYTDENAGQFQGRYEPETVPDNERSAAKLEELEKNQTMIQLKLFLDNANTIMIQASKLDIPLCDCIAKFDLRKCPPTVRVVNYTDFYDSFEKQMKGFLDSRSKDNIMCVYYSHILNEKLVKNEKTLQMRRLFPLRCMVMVKGVMEGNLLNLGQLDSLLRSSGNTPIQQVVLELGVLPEIAESLQQFDNHDIQKKAVSILLNVAGGKRKHTEAIVELGVIPHLVNLLSSLDKEIALDAAWALGNIAGDGPKNRDLALHAGILQPLITLLEQTSDVKSLRIYVWALSNCWKWKPRPKWNLVSQSLIKLKEMIHHSDDEVLWQACTALHYLSENRVNEQIQAIIDVLEDCGICRLLELCTHSKTGVQFMALNTIGNIVSGSDSQTQFIIDNNALPILMTLLAGNTNQIVKTTCFAISNIAAGSHTQVQAVIDCDIIPKLIGLLSNEASVKASVIRKEAAWALSNVMCGGSEEQVKLLMKEGIVPPLFVALLEDEEDIVIRGLVGLERVSCYVSRVC